MDGFTGTIIVSAFLFVVGFFSLKSGIRKQKVCTEIITAKVVDIHVTHNDGKERNSYSPIYSFELNGKEYKGTIGQTSKHKKDFPIGKEHDVKYNPENPQEFIDTNRNTSKITGIIFLIMGVIFLTIAIFIKK